MSKKPEEKGQDAQKLNIKDLMDNSDKLVNKAEKTMGTNSASQGDFSIETSGLETPEQAKKTEEKPATEAPKVVIESPKPAEKKEEPKPVEKKDDANGDFSIVTDRLVAPDEKAAPATPVAPAIVPPTTAAQKPVEAPKPAETPKPAEAKKDDTKQEIEKMKDQLAKSDKGVEQNLKDASKGQ